MKPISTAALSFTFVGGFLGAGYISGQELFQFFGAFGPWGFLGLFAAISILVIFNLMIVKIVKTTGNSQIDMTVVGSNNKPLLFSVGILETVVFFGTLVVMAAGAGALVKTLTGSDISYYIGSFVFCLAIAFLAVKGISGLIKIFSFAVPVLVVITFIVGISAMIKYGSGGFHFDISAKKNPLIPNWIAGAVTFASYNLFCSIGVLCPVGQRVKSQKSAVIGTVVGGLGLIVVAMSVLLSLAVMPEAKYADLPMIAVSGSISRHLAYVYSVLLFMAMSGAALASIIPINSYLAEHSEVCERHGAPTIFIISFLAFLLSCVGFADLVGTLFSSFGYVSLVGMFGIVRHSLKIRKNNAKNS